MVFQDHLLEMAILYIFYSLHYRTLHCLLAKKENEPRQFTQNMSYCNRTNFIFAFSCNSAAVRVMLLVTNFGFIKICCEMFKIMRLIFHVRIFDIFFFSIKHLHSNIKPTVTRHTYIYSYAWEKAITYKKGKKRAVTCMQ